MKRLYFWLAVVVALIILISVAFCVLGDDGLDDEDVVADEAKVAVTILDNREGTEDRELLEGDVVGEPNIS
jgi:hypothetical protein